MTHALGPADPASFDDVLCYQADDYRIEISRSDTFLEITGTNIFEGKDGLSEGLIVPFQALAPLIAALQAQQATAPVAPLH